jgi:formylglycine-generating enzyme required for sulfatase activity
MIAVSIKYAEALDFDSSERLLEEAALVNEDQSVVEQARIEIGSIKAQRAEALEAQAVQEMDSGDFQSAEKTLVNLVALGGQGDVVNQLRRRLEEARIYGGFQPGQVIRDHFVNTAIWAPDSVVILAGSYLMGSTISEPGRADNEGPQHRVTFRQGFAIGQREVSVGEFRMFAKSTGFRSDAERSGSSIVYDP